MAERESLRHKLAIANRILAREGVVDAFGHISVRDPDDPGQYLLSCSRAPGLVVPGDIGAFALDGTPAGEQAGPPYLERYIHGALFETRADVNAVVHNHAYELIPFGITGAGLRPVMHVTAAIGETVPVWDIRDKFGDTNLLVTDMDQGRDLAGCVGSGSTALMRGHGAVVAASSIEEAVLTAVYLMVNARILQDALALGDVTYLSEGEVALCREALLGDVPLQRVWQYFVERAAVEF